VCVDRVDIWSVCARQLYRKKGGELDVRVEIRHVPLLSVPLAPVHRICLIPLENRVDELENPNS